MNGGTYTFGALANGAYVVTPSQAGYTFSPASATVAVNGASVTLTSDPRLRRLIALQEGEELQENGALDVIFPVLHGTYGEDGTLQGMLEMANVPYVGCGVLGAALGMDKEKMKIVFQAVGLPIVDYLVYRRNEWERSPETIMDEIEQDLGYPCFVKPVNLGSSVGVSKAHDRGELEHAILVADRALRTRAGEFDLRAGERPR